MSTASALSLSPTATQIIGLWLSKSLRNLRTTPSMPAPQAAPRSASSHQEAEKLRAMARDMMRIDAGSAADMFAAADRHEFGHQG
ncbi:MAG: hypothetical protein R3E42_10260 [Burkholderiaceae bacterium]